MPTPHTEVRMQDARQGETGHGVRYVLGFGLALAVCAMLLVPVFAR
jgi:hypothetical protein